MNRNQIICYCHNYTVGDLEDDAQAHGRSLIMERIMAESRAGNCNCEEKNPWGR